MAKRLFNDTMKAELIRLLSAQKPLPSNSDPAKLETVTFMVDSRSMQHVVNDARLLKNLKPTSLVYEASLTSRFIGTGVGDLHDRELNLEGVIYAPEAVQNTISAYRLTLAGMSVIFWDGFVYIVNKEEKLLVGYKNLFGASFVELHIERGERHPSLIIYEPLEINLHENEPCRAKSLLEIVHIAIISPSRLGDECYAIVLDDFSHYVKFIPAEDLKYLIGHIEEYLMRCERKDEKEVGVIKCEFPASIQSLMRSDFFLKRKMIPVSREPDNPHLKASRINDILRERVRIILDNAGLGHGLWVEAMTVASYIFNLVPSSFTGRTPFEVWCNTRDSYYFRVFRVFGEKVCYLVSRPSESKVMHFVGYDSDGYRLWDPESKQFYSSNDILFVNEEENKATPKADKPPIAGPSMPISATYTFYFKDKEEEATPNANKPPSAGARKRNSITEIIIVKEMAQKATPKADEQPSAGASKPNSSTDNIFVNEVAQKATPKDDEQPSAGASKPNSSTDNIFVNEVAQKATPKDDKPPSAGPSKAKKRRKRRANY